MKTDRRDFIKSTAAFSCLTGLTGFAGCNRGPEVPSFLSDYAALYSTDPRQAGIEYFRNAKFGLFIHYGLYSLMKGEWNGVQSKPAEWVQCRSLVPVAEYAKLANQFTADKFDADFITDMVLGAGMKYINITTRHHDSFCLFDSKYTDFKSTNSAAKRDLVGELSEQCQKKGLGFYLYYSHGRDWKHPHAPNVDEWGKNARPAYDPPEATYKTGDEHNLEIYIEFMKNQITELLTNYGPIGAIWLDGVSHLINNPDKVHQFKLQELYDHIHSLQPHVLVSYKQGVTGTEDFKAPERHWTGGPSEMPLELCDTLQPKSWGYATYDNDNHKTADDVMEMLKHSGEINANLLLNTGPLPDGSIYPADVETLREVGRRLKG